MDDQLSPSSSTSSPLLNLPLELLDAIFAHVGDTKPPFQPLCRQLEPVQRRYHYRRLVVAEYEKLAFLCRAAPSIPGLEHNVVELKLAMRDESNSEHMRMYWVRQWRDSNNLPVDHLPETDSISDDEQTCPTTLLVDLISRLSALRELDLGCVELDLIDAVVGDDEDDGTSRSRPRRLERLEVLSVESKHGPMFKGPERTRLWISWLRKLARLPKLRDLRLTIYDGSPPPPLPAVDFSSPTLLSITLGDSDCIHPWNGPFLSQFAPNLERIDLSDVGFALKYAPSTMRELSLTSSLDQSDNPRAKSPLDDFLVRFRRLERLEIALNSFDPARLLPYLRSLPNFHSLMLSIGTPTTDTFLAALLDGPTRLPNLRHLTLDHVTSYRGGRLVSKRWNLPDDYDPTSAALLPRCRWEAPSYPPGASSAGVRAALRLAAAHGVVVDGSALAALEWDEAYRVERRAAVLAWAARTGRWDRAREVLGEDVVEVYRRGFEAGRRLGATIVL
ncbi:hypothetical protein JCM8208_004248 [Rhodotorula glutinis]